MSNCNGPTFCEVCGQPGDHISVEGWCTCAEHLAAPKPERRHFWWKTGEELNERGVAPSQIRETPRSRFDFERAFCEVCGRYPGGSVSVEGWNTCDEHFRAPKPQSPSFDHRTGVRLGPYDDPAAEEQRRDPRSLRYNAHFCEVCGASAGSVREGWTVCDRHFTIPLPPARMFDVRTGVPLEPDD